MAGPGLFAKIPTLGQTRESNCLLWVPPESSVALTLYHLRLDSQQLYWGAKTGLAYPPGSWPGNPYWIGEWARGGYCVMVDLESARGDPPYRMMMASDPYYVVGLADARRYPPLYGIIDSDPPVAAEAAHALGCPDARGYGLVERDTPRPAFPWSDGVPALPSMPALPSLPLPPEGYQPQPAPPPPERRQAQSAGLGIAAASAIGGASALALLWWLKRTRRIG